MEKGHDHGSEYPNERRGLMQSYDVLEQNGGGHPSTDAGSVHRGSHDSNTGLTGF